MAYKGDSSQIILDVHKYLEPIATPSVSKLKAKKVLNSRVKKSTRHKVYMEHLIQWKGKPNLEATWVAKAYFKKIGIPLDLIPSSSSLLLGGGSMVQEHLGRLVVDLGLLRCFGLK